MSYLMAHGAYGHDTNGPDWLAGKDFKIVNGPYFSIRDIELLSEQYDSIMFVNARDKSFYFSVMLGEHNPEGKITPPMSQLWPWVSPITKLLNKDRL